MPYLNSIHLKRRCVSSRRQPFRILSTHPQPNQYIKITMQSWSIVLKVNVPASGMQKMLRALPSDTIWNFKTSFMERAGMKDAYNHGLLVLDGKGFRYLAESVTFADEGITADVNIYMCPYFLRSRRSSNTGRRLLISYLKPVWKLMRKRKLTRYIPRRRRSMPNWLKSFNGALENPQPSDS